MHNLIIDNINKIAPVITKILFIGISKTPNPIYLFVVINKSTHNAYPVIALCIQQKWNTSLRANIKMEGRIEQLTILSAIIKCHPNIANIV